MRMMNARLKASTVAFLWHRQYFNAGTGKWSSEAAKESYEKLKSLGHYPETQDVIEIVGISWVLPECQVCGELAEKWIQFVREYSPFVICSHCIREANDKLFPPDKEN